MKGTYCGIAVALAMMVAPAIAQADVNVGSVTPVVSSTSTVPAAPSVVVSAPAPATAASIVVNPMAGSVSVSTPAASASVSAVNSVTKAVLSTPVAKATVTAKPRSIVTSARVSVAKIGHKVGVKASARAAVTRKLATTSQCPQTDPSNTHCVNQPFSTDLPNTCNGDTVHVEGFLGYSIQASFDPVSMTLTTFERTNWQNTWGIVIASPDPTNINNPYQANDTEKTYQNMFPVGPFGTRIATTHDENNELLSRGSDPNQIVHMTTNTVVTIDPTAIPVVSITSTVSGPGLKCTG